MLIPNHPDDERLSALASRETDATADATLTAHVSSCDRCTGLVNELGALRAALGELPDLRPSRPLQLIPAAEAPAATAADRLGGWARRFFTPVLASGAALALVGTIGTAAPALQGQSTSGDTAAEASEPAVAEVAAPAASSGGEGFAAAEDGSEPAAAAVPAPSDEATRSAVGGALGDNAQSTAPSAGSSVENGVGTLGLDQSGDTAVRDEVPAERSPWPLVLFAGVALMIAALLTRWILAPRTA